MSAGGPLAVFVYFKAPAQSGPAVRAALARVGAAVLAGTGVVQRHGPRHRPAAPDEPRTWLEIYEPVAPSSLEGFLAALDAAAAEAGLAALALQGRHLEVFECAPAGAAGEQRPCA